MLLILIFMSTAVATTNNVCKTYTDYATKSVNPNCWYNPDADAQPLEMVLRQGFPFEAYKIVTVDGYILSLFRIPHNNSDVGGKRQPVYLHHGLGTSSLGWYNHGPRSLAFALSNQGYDVWMANSRGTMYSLGHVRYTPKDRQYWDFSYPEMSLYDVSANLRFIRKLTGQKAIYVGHALGCTLSYVYAIEKKKEVRETLKGIVSLAPAAYFTSTNVIFKLLASIEDPLKAIGDILGIYSLEAHPPWRKTLINKICVLYPFNLICAKVIFLTLGNDYEELLPEELPLLFYDLPNGLSVKTVYHFGQEIKNGGRFQNYDYGFFGNLKKYGSKTPPEYDLKEIEFCVHLFYGPADLGVNPKDAELVHSQLRCSTLEPVEVNRTIKYNHLDFIYGKSVETALYPMLFKRLKEF